MNIQTEHLEDHTARLTVEIDAARLEKAKRAAAKKIARQVNIPGFRKGKAPYNIIVRNFGEATVLNEAVEDLSQEIYRETLKEHEETLQPYGPGAWEDFKLEPAPTFIYTIPLQPTVELNEYRNVRVAYDEPQIDDEAVDEAMERLRQQEALVEEIDGAAELHHRVTIDIHSTFADDAPASENEADEDEDAAASEDSEDEETTQATAEQDDDAESVVDDEAEDEETEMPIPEKGDTFVHEHDATVTLDPDDEPLLPGFNDEIIGLKVGEEAEFELTVPDDAPDYNDIAGRKVHVHVSLKKIESVTLPELNDDFAARVTQDEDEPLTLLQLRMRMRENLQNELTRRYKEGYSTEVLDAIVAQAAVAFPEAMVDEQMDSMVEDFEQRLSQQGMSLDVYMSVTGQDRDSIKSQYREPAINTIKRGLVLTNVMEAEQVSIGNEQIDARIDEMLTQFGEQAEALRSIFDTPQMRENIARDLLNTAGLERITAIGQGIAPEPGQPLESDEAEETGGEDAVSDEGTTDAEAVAEAEVEGTPEASAGDDAAADDETAPVGDASAAVAETEDSGEAADAEPENIEDSGEEDTPTTTA